MAPRRRPLGPFFLVTFLAVLTPLAAAQGVLSNGNSQFPACAASCMLLKQAAQACDGTTTADETVWNCFCQSGYLKPLYSSPVGICDSFCPDASDNQQVMTWYKSNCGTDLGLSEHQNGVAAAAPTTTTTAAATTSATSTSSSSSSSSGGAGEGSHTWWDTHWNWIVMVIVLAVGLIAVAMLGRWFKRRHERKRDQISGGFNEGITTRSAPMANINRKATDTSLMSAASSGGDLIGGGGGRDSPARTREAFMPYGYGYTRSETRMSMVPALGEVRSGSPLARGGGGGTPAEPSEKDAVLPPVPSAPTSRKQQKSRRVLVRARSVQGPERPQMEKRTRLHDDDNDDDDDGRH